MIFCIFSYNRGRHLLNCVNSIEQCIEAPDIRIFDDNSNDPETLEALATIAAKHTVTASHDEVGQSKHGGLYGNMQRALDSLPNDAYTCFLQDDMQLVRPLSNDELGAIYQHFDDSQSAVFLHPCFLKLVNRKKNAKQMVLSENDFSYIRDSPSRSAGHYYSDIFITQVKRLKQSGWRFKEREKLNEAQARQLFKPMHFLANPFIMWLPNVDCYRGKNKTLALRWAEVSCKAGFYPIKLMSQSEQKALISRNKSTLPFAENYLTVMTGKVKVPWIYYPLQGRGFLKKLNALELFFKKY